MLDAAVRRVPITGVVERVSAPEGSTLAEFVSIAFPVEAHRRFVVVSIDGEEVGPEAWDRVPRAGEHVQLAFRPGGKDFLRTILTIAVIAVSVWVGAGGLGVWFAAGTWQAAVAAAGVSILGNLAINALIPLPKPGTIEAPPPHYSLSTARNSSRPWGVVPMLFGTHRIAAPRMSEPFQEVLGGVTYLRVALCLGMCPMSVTDWKIGETALSAFSGVEMEVRLNEDDPAHTLITGDPTQEAVGATLSHTEWTERTTTTDVDEIEVIYDFPSGLGGLDSKGRKTARTVNLRLQYRPTGSSEDWSDWRPTVPQANTASAGAGAPFRPDYFTLEADLVAWRGQLGGMGGVASDIVPITRSDPGRAFRHSERFAVPRGQYDVRTQRAEAVSTDPNVSDAVSWGVLGSIRSQADPFPNRKLATACFRIKATDQLSNMVDTLNCLASSLQPVFSDDALADPTIASAAEFTDVETSSNPAILALLAARGPNTAFPKPDAEIDWPSFAAAAAKATARGLTFNEYVETSIGRWEMVRRILASMHARPVKHNGKLSVVVDDSKAGQPPAQVFSPRNVRNFRWQKTYPRLPHAIRTPFANAANNWGADEVTVFMPGYTAETATRYETVAMPGKTDADEIRTVVNQYARNGHFQTESFEFETDAEHLTVKRGDYCVVQHFAMATGLGAARIRTRELNGSSEVTAIILDRPVETPEGESLAVQWRTIVADSGLARMEVLGEQAVTRDAANPKRFVFTTPQAGDTKPAAAGEGYEGDIALVGIAGKVSFEVLVRDIAPRPHLQAAISCIAYAGERFVDAPEWPAHDPRVTLPYAPRPPAPVLQSAIAGPLEIAVAFTQPAMPRGLELRGYVVARREHGAAADSWEPLGQLRADERVAIAPAGEPGAKYDVRIVGFGRREDGATVYSDALIVAEVEAATAPAAPAGCGGAFTTRTSSGGAQQLVLTATWTANENPDVLDTVVEQRVSTGPDVWQEIGRGAAATGRTEIHGLPVGRAYVLGFTNISKRGAPSSRTTISSITAPDTLVATGALTAVPGGALDDALDDLDTAMAAAASAIDAAEARLDDAEDTLDLHGTDIGTLETVTASQATLITGLQSKTTINANLLPNSTGAGGLEGWVNPGDWQVYDHPLWGPWLNRTFTGESTFTEYFYNNDLIDVFATSQYTVSFSPFLAGLDGGSVTFYVVYYDSGGGYVGEGGNLVLTADSTSGVRYSANFTTGATTAKVRFAVAMVNAVGDATYAHVGFWQAKIERGATATVWSDDGTLQEARARITTVESVNSDQDSAIATLDSRLDAAETDIDDVTGDVTTLTAANLISRMTAVDGGSASAQTLSAVKAELEGDIAGEASIRSAAVTSLESADADHDSAIATLDSRLDAAETDVDGLESTASNHTTRLAAIDGGSSSATSIAQLVAKTTPRRNLILNSTGLRGTAGWTTTGELVGLFGASAYPESTGPRFYLYPLANLSDVDGTVLGDMFAVDSPTGDWFTLSGFCHFPGYVSGTAHIGVEWYNSAQDTWLGWITQAATVNGAFSVSGQLPAGAAYGRPFIFLENVATDSGYAELYWYRVKFEGGQAASLWTDDAEQVSAAARITEVESVASDNESAIAVIDSRMDAAETDIDGVQSTASNLSTRMTAVDGGSALSQTQTALKAELVAKTNPGQNLMPYPSGLGDSALASTIGWNVFSAPTPSQALYMPYYSPAGGAFYYIVWASGYNSAGAAYIVYEFPNAVVPGQVLTISLAGNTNLSGVTYSLGARNSSHSDLGFSSAVAVQLTRNSVSYTMPTGAAYATLVIQINAQNSAGAYRELYFRDIKLELGSVATVFSDDYGAGNVRARVTETEEAIADEVSARAAFQTTAEADIAGLEATATTQGGAIVDLEGGTAWIESVVSAGGGDLGAARMRAGKAGSFLDLIFTVIRLANVSNGSVLEVMRAVGGFAYFSNPVSIDVGGKRMTLGPGFGVSSDLLFWFGPDTTDIDDMTKTNGHWAWATDGETYKGTGALVDATINEQTKTSSTAFNNVTTSGTTVHTLATIDLTVGASGYLELLSPLFFGPLSINAETGMTLSAGSDWFGQMIITEQLQSGGTEHTLWTIPIQISDTGGGLFDFIFDPPVTKVVAQNVSGASRYRIKLQRTSGSNNVSGNGLQGIFTIRRTP